MSILIDASTTFIVQGITGREAVNLTRECLDYGKGAKVVGGVTPGKGGTEHLGLPEAVPPGELRADLPRRRARGGAAPAPRLVEHSQQGRAPARPAGAMSSVAREGL
mgnify:CR=1 FL=1